MLTFAAFLTEAHTVTVIGRVVPVTRPTRARDDVLVDLLVAPVDAAFARTEFYIGVDGVGGISDRYARFGQFIAATPHLDAPEIVIRPDGGVGFINGRHRWAWLRDQGVSIIPCALNPRDLPVARRFGYLA
jgi:hypothetical protein